MTDRYYPQGMESAEGVWKSTYEMANEMRSFQRSAYPPGYAGFEPGSREKFGYSTPGPIKERLARSDLALTDDAELFEPRRHQAIPRTQVSNDRETFEKYDLPEVERSRHGFFDTQDMSKTSLPRVQSLPALQPKPAPPPLRGMVAPIDTLEDMSFTYFVPSELRKQGKQRLNASRSTLSKLDKLDKAVLSLDGGGTGFKTQCQNISWDPSFGPQAPRLSMETSYRRTFSRPPFFRMSPIGMKADMRATH